MAMIQHQCPRFHLYNAPEGQDSGCPVCAAQQADLTRTRGVWGDAPPAADISQNTTVDPARAGGGAPGGKTVGIYAHLGGAVDPVVGWLACVDGPDKGQDWRLVSGRNAIGRAEGMSVRLAADASVSRERHAVISFDPRRRSFSLAPGEGPGLVYCNGQEVVMPVTLAPHDRIEVGASTLLFVPLVGQRFSWDP
jgi:FHA domain